MVSIETYRARIGTFNGAGKTRQVSSKSFDPSLLDRDVPQHEYFQVLRINNLLLFMFSLLYLVLLVPILLSTDTKNIPQGWTGSHVSQQCLDNYEVFHKSYSILKSSVLATQLIIGNVEANPGPVDLKEFLAFLFVDAEDIVVKEVLKEIKASQDRQTNLKKVKSKNVDALKATLAYLHDWNKDDEMIKSEIDVYTKEGIAILLIKKIYNMAPQKCSTCLQTSHFKPGEYCILSCVRCTRSACTNCYESEKAKLNSLSMLNRNIFYMCETCNSVSAKENQPEEAHKKKSCGKKTAQLPESSPTESDQSENITGEQSETIELDDSDADMVENSSDKEEPSKKEELSKKAKSAKESSSSPKEHPICWFYKQNKCKFGISGKGCDFNHPKICQRLLSHGTGSQKGCIKDGMCKFFHPPMCKNSLNKRLCTNLSCEYMHIKGTKRSESQSQHLTDAREKLVRMRNQKHSSENSTRWVEREHKQDSGPFLEKSLNPPSPPTLESGSGSGGDLNLKMMELLQQLVLMQRQQLLLLQHPQFHQTAAQMNVQTQHHQQIHPGAPQMILQQQLPGINPPRNLLF